MKKYDGRIFCLTVYAGVSMLIGIGILLTGQGVSDSITCLTIGVGAYMIAHHYEKKQIQEDTYEY